MASFVRKAALAGMAAMTMSGAMSTMSAPAEARGGAIAAGVLGGLAVGAIIGSAARRPYYGGYGYPAYAAPVYGGGCYFVRRTVYDAYGNPVGRRPVRVCD